MLVALGEFVQASLVLVELGEEVLVAVAEVMDVWLGRWRGTL